MSENQQLLAHAKAIEVGVVARTIVDFWRKKNPLIDQKLQQKFEELDVQSKILQNSYGTQRKGSYTKAMRKYDKQNSNLFVGLKYLVKAYLYHPDKEIVKSANEVWAQIVTIGVDIHKGNKQAKLTGFQVLVRSLLEGKRKEDAKKLIGVDAYLNAIHNSFNQLKKFYTLDIGERAERKQRIQTTAQARKVLKILNKEIFPVLFVFRKIDPGNYNQLAKFAELELKKVNREIRARRLMWARRRKKYEQEIDK